MYPAKVKFKSAINKLIIFSNVCLSQNNEVLCLTTMFSRQIFFE